MEYEIIGQKEHDLGRGVALLAAGAVMMLLKLVLPAVAPVALAAYGIYRLFMKNFVESGVALLLAVVFWLLMDVLGGLLWLLGAAMAGFGLFFLIRSVRGKYKIE